MKIGLNGMVKLSIARETGLPIYDYRVTANPGHHSDLCEDVDFKSLGEELTQYEKCNLIRGFVIYENWRGCKPLYSLKEIFEGRRSHAHP